jgi:hypothetical protein
MRYKRQETGAEAMSIMAPGRRVALSPFLAHVTVALLQLCESNRAHVHTLSPARYSLPAPSRDGEQLSTSHATAAGSLSVSLNRH